MRQFKTLSFHSIVKYSSIAVIFIGIIAVQSTSYASIKMDDGHIWHANRANICARKPTVTTYPARMAADNPECCCGWHWDSGQGKCMP